MDELQTETGPINPYAKTFFWLWGVALLALTGIKTVNLSRPAGADPIRSETSWLNTAIQQTKNAAELTGYLKPVRTASLTIAN